MTTPSGDKPGGDIQTSAPRTNEDGEQVFDIALSYGVDTLKQNIYARVKTQAPDWFLHPNLGGNLEDLIGEPNTRDTAQKGIKLIHDALTYGDFLTDGEFNVKAVPINKEEVVFFIVVDGVTGQVTVPIQFSYNYGMKLVEE